MKTPLPNQHQFVNTSQTTLTRTGFSTACCAVTSKASKSTVEPAVSFETATSAVERRCHADLGSGGQMCSTGFSRSFTVPFSSSRDVLGSWTLSSQKLQGSTSIESVIAAKECSRAHNGRRCTVWPKVVGTARARYGSKMGVLLYPSHNAFFPLFSARSAGRPRVSTRHHRRPGHSGGPRTRRSLEWGARSWWDPA